MSLTAPPSRTTTRTVARLVLAPVRDERLALYLGVAGAAVALAVFGGGLRTMVIAVPFLIAVALGARRADIARLAARVELTATRCLEGDRIEGLIEIAAPDRFDVELAIERDGDDIAPDDGRVWAWHVPAGTPRPFGVPVTVTARRWGRHPLGDLRVRLVEPGSFFTRESMVTALPSLDVLPRGTRDTTLLPLRSVRAVTGSHRSRRSSPDGYEFAELAPYRPGDRIRDINWAATLRRDEPYVNRRTPEPSGDLVLVLESFPDALRRHSLVARDAISWSGRLAWTVATAHLGANDRVGVLVEGATVRWLAPRTGRRARFEIFEMLLALSRSSASGGDLYDGSQRVHVPSGAKVLAITPLARRTTLDRLSVLRATEHDLEILAVDVGALLHAHAPSVPATVARLRQQVFDERVAAMRRQGIRVTVAIPRQDEP